MRILAYIVSGFMFVLGVALVFLGVVAFATAPDMGLRPADAAYSYLLGAALIGAGVILST